MKKQNSLRKNKEEIKLDPADISKKQDLAFGVMNLISIEEHLAYSVMKAETKEEKQKIQAIYNEVRKKRAKYLQKLITNKKYEMWCTAKHFLASVMRLMEVGIKEETQGNKDAATEYFSDAKDLYDMFWLIQMMEGVGRKNENDATKSGKR